MPRQLPPLADDFSIRCAVLLDFAVRLEINFRTVRDRDSKISLSELELSYELIYLKIFLIWENLLESAFYRLLCGYSNSVSREILLPGQSYARSLKDAETLVLNGKDYVYWHSVRSVIKRSDIYFAPPLCRFRLALRSSPNLASYAAIRHRIAHQQKHARDQFYVAAMDLFGRRYAGANAGRLLRDVDRTVPGSPRRVSVIASDLEDIARAAL